MGVRAASHYKQVRLTITEERELGHPELRRLSLRVLVKPLQGEWTEKHVVLVKSHRHRPPLDDLQAVYRALLDFLAEEPLPGHIG